MSTTGEAASGPTRRPVAMRLVRLTGTSLIVLGALCLVWVVVVWQWQDPFTALYTRWQQHNLSAQYARVVRAYTPLPQTVAAQHRVKPSLTVERRALLAEAARYRRTAKQGAAIGRIDVPRLGLHMVLVNGTDHDSLVKGPGRDRRTYMPGQGQLVYVAGHRTTYLAPFARIDSMRPGDRVTLKMPYATIVYSVTSHEIVAADDLAVLKSHSREVLALQACHPRFFATHRYIVWATPVKATLANGRSWPMTATAAARH